MRLHMLPPSMTTETYWLTIYIGFAPLFCKSQKWVAVATATCYLACQEEKKKTNLQAPSKTQIQHVFLLFLPLQEKKSPDSRSVFFRALKMGLLSVICIFIMYTTNLCKWERKKIHRNRKEMDTDCMSHTTVVTVVFYSIPTFIVDGSFSQFNPLRHQW